MVMLKENNDAILIASVIKQIEKSDIEFKQNYLNIYKKKLNNLKKKNKELLSLKTTNSDNNIIRTHRKGY